MGNELALINAEISAIESELDILYKGKLSELMDSRKQKYQPDMAHQDKVIQKGYGGEEAKAEALKWMSEYKPAVELRSHLEDLKRHRDMIRGARSGSKGWGLSRPGLRYFGR